MDNTRSGIAYVSAIALGAVLLLVGAVGLFLWLSSGPSVYASGHRWALYPLTGDDPEPDSSSQQEDYEGNFKLFSLLYAEHFTDDQGEQVQDVLCHVLMDMPAGADLSISGSGGSDADGFMYKKAKAILNNGDAEPPQETDVTLRFRHSDKRLSVVIEGAEVGVETVGETGSVFMLRIDKEGQAEKFKKIGAPVPHPLDAGELKQMLQEAEAIR